MMASLPPISAITRLIQIWPGWCFAASSLIRSPTSREPVKDDEARLRMLHQDDRPWPRRCPSAA